MSPIHPQGPESPAARVHLAQEGAAIDHCGPASPDGLRLVFQGDCAYCHCYGQLPRIPCLLVYGRFGCDGDGRSLWSGGSYSRQHLRGACAMADELFPGDTPEQAEARIDRVWESLRATPRDDPDRIQKARDAYLMDPNLGDG